MMQPERITQAIRKAIVDRGARSPAEREKIYAAARIAVGRQMNGGTNAAVIEAAISAIEASFAPKPEKKPHIFALGPAIRNSLAPIGIGVLFGALMVAAVWALMPASQDGNQVLESLERRYNETLPQVPVAVDFLRKVSDSVIAMQKSDRAGLEAKAAKTFIQLRKLDPELAAQMPASLPRGSSVIVRANAFDFKILFNWTLCGAVQMTHPAMVDGVRTKADVLGCPYFGLWTPAAANW
jgi:hypothetical protein